jgi:hypothetical protein
MPVTRRSIKIYQLTFDPVCCKLKPESQHDSYTPKVSQGMSSCNKIGLVLASALALLIALYLLLI